ncbi:metal-dependent hydrolase family protein [Aliidiomarina soli]|uniref:Amidohydrolase n=1 Tax=Aliidiomarina soli TaxID=1928574 RepID=A0A432WIU9_9GAMM|nr:amidohydrolase family protein [Aliidiomarina soli]RUO33703.1 amidohydrolase [Aliidiomarina soli]
MKAILATLGVTASLAFSSQLQAATYIHAGTLIDGTDNDPRSEVTIVVEDGRFARVESGFQQPSDDDTLIDLRQSTVMPGFIDSHTHLSSQLSQGSYMNRFTDNPATTAVRAAHYARLTLHAGFTTVRELGDSDHVSVALRNGISQGLIEGPRIFAAGKSLATTGGHADPTNNTRDSLIGDAPTPADGVVNGPIEARQAVRKRYQDGADLIKLTATGGVLSMASSGDNPQFMMDELESIVTTAQDYGMTVAVHAHGREGMLRAVRAGVDSIEHGTYMDEEVMAAMREHGTYYVPTITAGKSVAERAEIDGFFPEMVRPKARAIGPLIQQTFADAYNAGVNIAFGTDAGVFDHGENYREFGYMVEAGMPAMEAIRSATYHAATLLKQDDDLGTVEAGKLADLVAVEGDPLADISILSEIHFVMRDGQVFKQN